MTHDADLLLTSTNWNDEWKKLQGTRREPDDAAYWDKRAATFHTGDAPSAYTGQFLELAAIRPGESVFDMGCGNGALALPLASAGHRVIAADFSRGMLDGLEAQAHAKGIEGVEVKRISWTDDWKAAGVTENCVDVAIASRSVATYDLENSLRKLTAVARQRACVTLSTGPSPHTDAVVLEALGLPVPRGFDYLYAHLILSQLGYLPEIHVIESPRVKTFDTFEEACEKTELMARKAVGALVDAPALDAALSELPRWMEDNLVPNEHAGQPDGHGGAERALRLRTPRIIRWAFISWDTAREPTRAW